MSDDLPEGWDQAPFEVLFEFALGGDWGKSPAEAPKEWQQVRVMRGTEYRDWTTQRGRTAALRTIKPASLDKRQLREDDLVVEVSGGGPDQPVGRSVVIDAVALGHSDLPLVCSNFCRMVRLSPAVSSAFVNLCLQWRYANREFDQFQNATVNIKNLEFPRFASETLILLPPFAEQRRIVAQVEALLARVNAARQRLAKAPVLLKRFRQSVLAAACSGRLTADWRKCARPNEDATEALARLEHIRRKVWEDSSSGRRYKQASDPAPWRDSDIPQTWAWTTVSQLARLDVGFAFKSSEYAEAGIRLLRGENIEPGSLRWNDVRYWPKNQLNGFEKLLIEEGDVILALDRPLISTGLKLARARAEDLPCLLVQRMMRFKVHDPDMTAYLHICLSSPTFVEALQGSTTGSDLPHITGTGVADYSFPFPPPQEQHEIVRRVEALFKLADAIEKRVAAATARADKLTQAILAKAFRGELVPTEADLARREGRDYEPASDLLKRIQAERGTATNSRSQVKRRAPKSRR